MFSDHGCQDILRGTSRQATSEASRERMRAAIASASAGQRRIQIQTEKDKVRLASAQQVSQAPASAVIGARVGLSFQARGSAERSAQRITGPRPTELNTSSPSKARLETDSHRVMGNDEERCKVESGAQVVLV